jgi:GTP pyrophosphokinase
MDDIAEKGIAAHWMYKRNGYLGEGDYEMDAWLQSIKEILMNPDVNALELLDIIHNDLTATEIYVFTPKGDQRSIQKGATALDFAYLIHTEVGNKAIAAKVNQRLVKLSHVLKTGDKVEIITAEDAKPQPEWIKFLTTRRARTIVMDYFKAQRKQTVDFGKKTLENTLTSLGIENDERNLQRLQAAYAVDSREEMYYGIGLGNLSLDLVPETLKKQSSSRLSWLRRALRMDDETEQQTAAAGTQPVAETFIIGSSDPNGPRFSIASCCNPIPGDPVVGFKAPDGSVTVHKKACPVAESIAAMHGDWVVVPKWLEQAEDNAFLVRITLKGLDRVGMLNEISRYVSLVMGVNMRRLSLQAESGLFEGYIDMYVQSRETLEQMIKKLSSIEGIESVIRTDL